MKDYVSLVGLWKLKSKSSAVILITLTFFWIKYITLPYFLLDQMYNSSHFFFFPEMVGVYPRYLPF